ERDQFLKKFTGGAKLTEDFLREFEQQQERLRQLEAENAALRAKVEADEAIRDLLSKIERLENEKRELVSRFHRAEAVNSEFTARVQEVESEFANLANLFVASNQLHSSLSPRGVTRRIKEVLAQLVGAERYCMYLANADSTELVPIAYEGVAGAALTPVKISDSELGQALLKGAASVSEQDPTAGTVQRPAAIIPLSVDEKTVGVIAIFSTLAQKKRFDTVDFELFKLLGQHAAAALVSASLFAHTDRKLPGLEAFLDLSV
ncbi:MAG TPA: GAF domain-containing protein, partial [Polyangiaceae bacterium]|nr:GAF domain-containing protein [Polyangiaceae bacterium]